MLQKVSSAVARVLREAHLLDNVHSLGHRTKDDMLAVQPCSLRSQAASERAWHGVAKGSNGSMLVKPLLCRSLVHLLE